jgi:hypothetical protein
VREVEGLWKQAELYPAMLTATGPVDDPRFAFVASRAASSKAFLGALDHEDDDAFAAEVAANRDKSQVLTWATVWGAGSERRIAAIYRRRTKKNEVGWNYTTALSLEKFWTQTNAFFEGGVRPHLLTLNDATPTHEPTYLGIWWNDSIGPYGLAFPALLFSPDDETQQIENVLIGSAIAGYYPVRLQAALLPNNIAYYAILAKDDARLARQLHTERLLPTAESVLTGSKASAVGTMTSSLPRGGAPGTDQPIAGPVVAPVTGSTEASAGVGAAYANETVAAFDEWAIDFVKKENVRALSLAVAREGRLVYAAAHTFAEIDGGYPITEPHHAFRLLSCSKAITSIAIHKLLDRTKRATSPGVPFSAADLERTLVSLGLAFPTATDPRWADITVDHCLRHETGFSRAHKPNIDDVRSRNVSKVYGHYPCWKREFVDFVADESESGLGASAFNESPGSASFLM